MTLKTLMAADLDDVFYNTDEFADSITYNGATINAVFEFRDDDWRERKNFSRAICAVKVSDVPSPTYRDTIVRNGITYRVYRDDRQNEYIRGDGYEWYLPVITDERPKPI